MLPFSPLLLTFLGLAAYAACTWWLLREEDRGTLIRLGLLTICAAILRLIFPYDFPPGVNDDEVKSLLQAFPAFKEGRIFDLGIEGPILHTVLFEVPVVKALGSLFWGMRLYPIIFGALAVPISFSIGRAVHGSTVASYVLSILVAVLPWSLFWSRIPWGGEIIFYQCLLVAALARIVWARGGFIDSLIGSVGLIGLLWEYTGAWSMVGMPMVAVVLAPGRKRRLCALCIYPISFLAWLPYLVRSQSWLNYITEKVAKPQAQQSVSEGVSFLLPLLNNALRVFRFPEGNVSWISMHSVAIHPDIVLATAILGLVCVTPRKSLFVLAGFCSGILTAVVSYQSAPSTHRMICAFLFVSISSAGALKVISDRISKTSTRQIASAIAGLFCAFVAIRSCDLFFSPAFWKQSEHIFFHGETLLTESFRPSAASPAIVEGDIYRYLQARDEDTDVFKILNLTNWMPTAPVQQAFSRGLEQLLPFYQESLPASRVQVFGGEGHQKSFIADFREADVALWKSYGWDLQIDCRDGLSPQSYKVPTLLLDKRLFFGLSTCPNLGEYTFTSTWVAETTELSLRLFGRVRANVDCPTGSLAEEVGPTSASVKFKVRSGDRLVITLSTDDPSASAHLHQVQGEIAKIPKMQTCARSSK